MTTLELIQTQFHWLRPLWWLAILPVTLLGIALWRQRHHAHQWQKIIAPELLQFLIDGNTTRTHPWKIWALIAAWIIACIALAGPAWEKRPMPVQKNQDALVLILDLSPSMLSEDIKPSRLVRARLKIADILRERKDGLTALVGYAGEAHVVTPLTDDTATINSLLTSLHPNVMPLPGSNTEDGINLALRLLKDAGINRGDLLLITDGVVEHAHKNIQEQLGNQIRLSILGVGSDKAVPIPGPNGGFLRGNNSSIVTTQLESRELRKLAYATGGKYSTIATDNSDINALLSLESVLNEEHRKVEREFDNWYDNGYWLGLLLLPFILYCFRRGVLVVLILAAPAFLFYSPPTMALSWNDLWLTDDQQGQKALEQGDAVKAAEEFKSPEWKGSAQYRAGDYEAAAQNFAQSDTAQAHYNRGNALAKAGKLDNALKAYDEALKRDPELQDAKANRDLVAALKEQQEQQKQDGEGDENQDQQNQEQQDKDQQGQDQQNDQENQDQQKSDSESEQSGGQNSSESDAEKKEREQKEQEQKEQEQREQEEKEAAEQEQKDAQQSSSEPSDEERQEAEDAMNEGGLTKEEQQSLEQWLRRVPDDPGGLLRNKFRYQYQQKIQERQQGLWNTPNSEAEERW